MREQTNYDNAPVYYRDIEVYTLDHTFHYSNNTITGAVGSVVVPVTNKEYETSTSQEEVTNYAKDIWKEQVRFDCTEQSLEEWVEDAYNELIECMFEESPVTPELPEAYYNKLGISKDDVYLWQVVGYGRIFHDFELSDITIVDNDLYNIVKDIEE